MYLLRCVQQLLYLGAILSAILARASSTLAAPFWPSSFAWTTQAVAKSAYDDISGITTTPESQ